MLEGEIFTIKLFKSEICAVWHLVPHALTCRTKVDKCF